ncbi:MAG: DUF805 domain-containing protein [Lactovum sp.]
MFKAYIKFWKQSFKIEGKSTRADYWWVFLLHLIIKIIFFLINVFLVCLEFFRQSTGELISMTTTEIEELALFISQHPSQAMMISNIILAIFNLLILIPTTTLTGRRLKDAGYPLSLAYPLPAIFLVNIVLQFLNFSSLILLSNICQIYYLIILIFCIREKVGAKEV